MSRLFIDVHVIQTVPPSNMNRDDTGSPKSAVYGGVRRARVSSQAWKRAARRDFENYLDASELGVRTKRLVELVAEEIRAADSEVEPEVALGAAKEILTKAGIKVKAPKANAPEEAGYLVFLSRQQVRSLAAAAVEALRGDGVSALAAKEVQALVKGKNSIDLALFGRMVADVTDLNVDAAAQVAHAISVHAVETEFDYFTAVDDHKQADADEDAGAGMIGTVEFNSATLYRYATVDVATLQDNLGDSTATQRAVAAFVRSFVRSLPTGKQNTFANRTLPDAVVVVARSDQPVNWVGAFEEPVDGASGGRVAKAVDRLVSYAEDLGAAFGAEGARTWVTGVGSRTAALDRLGERVTFDELVSALAQHVATQLEDRA